MMKKAFQCLMVLQGLLWIFFGIQATATHSAASAMHTIIIALMLLNGVLFILFALFFRKALWLKILTILFLAGNVALTVTDQMGFLDYLVLLLNSISIIAFVILARGSKVS